MRKRKTKMKSSKDKPELKNPTEQEGICPLCHRLAKFEPIRIGIKRRYHCPTCKSFIISTSDEETISNLTEKERITISDECQKCDPDNIVRIYLERTPTRNMVQTVQEPRRNWW
jgi:hypothetical protein